MRQFFVISLVFFFLSFSFTPSVSADSQYVLPYPSAMPGSMYYKIHLIWEKIMQYWYFGDLGQFDYNRMQSDKYLVEAKTLFEYNQYLFGYQALQKSDAYFEKISPHLIMAMQHGKQTREKQALLQQEATKHIEVLEKMRGESLQKFLWQPEKAASTELDLWHAVQNSEQIRRHVL